MIKYILTAIITICFIVVNGQQQVSNPFTKTITVSGSAEMDVVPDQIYVYINLREYQKRGESKKDLDQIKGDFLSACKNAAIADSAISIVSYTGYNNYYFLRRKKKKDPDMFTGITYQVIFSNSRQMDELVDKLDDEATQSFDIAYTSHSRMTEFRKQLKIDAIKAAKAKAIYLTEAIGEKLGPAITITEPAEPSIARGSNISYANTSNGYSKASSGYDKGVEVDFKKSKMRFEVTVIFALSSVL